MGAQLRRAKKPIFIALALGLLFPGIVVASETSREYQAWENRPWGMLEHFHSLFTNGLPAAPDWRCGYRHHADPIHGKLTIVPVLIGDHPSDATLHTAWDEEIERRIPLDVDLEAFERVETNDEAHALARHRPDTLFVGFASTYHRGPRLNERMEGFACANLAIVTQHTECAGAILAHEVGHALGLRHVPDGLMRPRDVTCDDRLTESQTSWILDRYGPFPDPSLPLPVPEPGPVPEGQAAKSA